MNPDADRHDLYGPIHKALRKATAELLIDLGQTDFTDTLARDALARRVRGHLELLQAHLRHEEEFVHPYLEAQGADTGETKVEHEQHAALAEAVHASLEQLCSAAPTERARRGHALYLAFGALFAHDLSHMAREEVVLQPRLQQAYADEEIAAIEGRILGSMAPPEFARNLQALLSAINGRERLELVGRLVAALSMGRPT